jgi:hypothetical protein
MDEAVMVRGFLKQRVQGTKELQFLPGRFRTPTSDMGKGDLWVLSVCSSPTPLRLYLWMTNSHNCIVKFKLSEPESKSVDKFDSLLKPIMKISVIYNITYAKWIIKSLSFALQKQPWLLLPVTSFIMDVAFI